MSLSRPFPPQSEYVQDFSIRSGIGFTSEFLRREVSRRRCGLLRRKTSCAGETGVSSVRQFGGRAGTPGAPPGKSYESTMGEKINILDVSARDGLQNEPRLVSTADKLALITKLVQAGVRDIQATSFVHPRWVPQMADA